MEFDTTGKRTKRLYLDSEYRSGGSVSEYRVKLNPKMNNVLAYRIENIAVVHSYLNMWPQLANLSLRLEFSVAGVVTLGLINLPYTIYELVDELNTQLAASAVSGVVEFRQRYGRIELNSSIETFDITVADLNVVGSVWRFLGFTDADAITTVLAQQGSNAYNVSGPGSIFIHSSALAGTDQYKIKGNDGVLTPAIDQIIVNANSGSTISNQQPTSWTPVANNQVDIVDVSLRYNDGTLVDLRGLNWQATLVLLLDN